MVIVDQRAVSGASPGTDDTLMNTHDIYVQYESAGAFKGCAPKVLRAYVKVPRAKIQEYRREENDYTSSDNAIAQTLSESLAFNLLGQLRGYWIGCRDTLPIEFQERGPAFRETDGMAFWAIKK